jgi:transposase
MQISTIGVDIGKNSFHFVGFDARGGIVIRRQCSRPQLIRALANLPPCLVGMEACCGAHHLGRILVAQGHDVRLIPPQYVKPFVKSHKNDLLDAEAIGEAVQRPTMRFVPLKTMEQLDLQAIHRLRTRLVRRRTAVINQLRGFLLERGVTFPIGRRVLIERFPEVLDNPALGLSVRFCRLLQQLRDEWRLLDGAIHDVDQEILSLARDDEACDRLMQVPGIGPLTATALVAAVGNGAAFATGRDLSAWLGFGHKQARRFFAAVLDRDFIRANLTVKRSHRLLQPEAFQNAHRRSHRLLAHRFQNRSKFSNAAILIEERSWRIAHRANQEGER